MLCHRPNNQKPEASHLVECVSSATAIIAIFDLYCRTFGVDYCILSLSYSVYTAASVFLLQIQAAQNRDDEALERLKFCITSLEKVKTSNPGISNSLSYSVNVLTVLCSDRKCTIPDSGITCQDWMRIESFKGYAGSIADTKRTSSFP